MRILLLLTFTYCFLQLIQKLFPLSVCNFPGVLWYALSPDFSINTFACGSVDSNCCINKCNMKHSINANINADEWTLIMVLVGNSSSMNWSLTFWYSGLKISPSIGLISMKLYFWIIHQIARLSSCSLLQMLLI